MLDLQKMRRRFFLTLTRRQLLPSLLSSEATAFATSKHNGCRQNLRAWQTGYRKVAATTKKACRKFRAFGCLRGGIRRRSWLLLGATLLFCVAHGKRSDLKKPVPKGTAARVFIPAENDWHDIDLLTIYDTEWS
jgi:hypothetical protein